MKFLYDFLIFN